MRSTCLLSVCLLIAAPNVLGQQASYVMAGSQLPVAKNSNGHVQVVTPLSDGGVHVQVTTTYGAVGAVGPYQQDRSAGSLAVPAQFDLPTVLRRDLLKPQTAWSAATLALRWAATKIRHDEDDMLPQDAESVIRRRQGRCSGIANTAAALLMAAGFEARTVSGLLVTDSGPIPHRWVECNLPGAGWVPSDPTLGLWVLTPRHVAFSNAVEEIPSIRVIDHGETLLGELPRREGLLSRPNLGSELVCRLVEPVGRIGTVVARLNGPAGEMLSGELDPVFRFTGLLPGRWSLEVELDGRILERHRLKMKRGETHSLVVLAGGLVTEVDS
jgi:hypothetical protein